MVTPPLQVGFSTSHADPVVRRNACTALQRLGLTRSRLSAAALQPAITALVGLLVGQEQLPTGWFTAAEAAISAVYALHPAPHQVLAAVLQHVATSVLNGASGMFMTTCHSAAQHLDLASLTFGSS